MIVQVCEHTGDVCVLVHCVEVVQLGPVGSHAWVDRECSIEQVEFQWTVWLHTQGIKGRDTVHADR